MSLAQRSASPAYLHPQTIDDINKLATIFAGRDPEKQREAANKIIRGAELGFSAAYSCDNIHWMQGKCAISAKAYGRLVKRRAPEYDYEVLERTETKATLRFLRNGDVLGTYTYTIEDANKAGLTGRALWKTQPKNMLFARCMTGGVTIHCPEIEAAGFYTDDEMLDVIENAQDPAVREVVAAANNPSAATIAENETQAEIAAAERAATAAPPVDDPTIGPEIAQGLIAQTKAKGLGFEQVRALLTEFGIARASLLPKDRLESFQVRIDEIAAEISTAAATAQAPQATTVTPTPAAAASAPAPAPAAPAPTSAAATTPPTTGTAKGQPGDPIGKERAEKLLANMHAKGLDNTAVQGLLQQSGFTRLSTITNEALPAFCDSAKALIAASREQPNGTTAAASDAVSAMATDNGLPVSQVLSYLRETYHTTDVATLSQAQLSELTNGLATLKPVHTGSIASRAGVTPMHLQ